MFLFGDHGWRGESGQRYRFKTALSKHDIPGDSGGIYVFVRRRWVFFLEPLYVGKAHNLRSRLWGHEKWPRAFWYYGATERHTLKIAEEADRRRVEEDLIRGLNPRMNDVMVLRSAKDAPSDRRLRAKWERRNRWRSGAAKPRPA
ncbi:MAG: GIY-YIG nuclease family protein [Alphaproteobacteria bacterium]|nr:GIY-YIG nuclease family protein [Alphaproteobacteria bacterium]